MSDKNPDTTEYRLFKFGELTKDRPESPGAAGAGSSQDPFKQIYGPRMAAVNERLRINSEKEKEKEKKVDPEEIARRVIAAAEEDAAGIREAAKREGFDAGLAQGREKLEMAAERLNRIAIELASTKPRLLAEATEETVNLAVAICERILGPLAAESPAYVTGVVTSALSAMSERENVTVRINPSDMQTLIEAKPEILSVIDGVKNLTFLDDPSVQKGGCIVETGSTEIDARLKTQLDEIVRALGPQK